MGIVNEAGRSNDGMRSSWSYDRGDTKRYFNHLWLVEDGERIRIQHSMPIASDNVKLAIPTGVKHSVTFLKSSRGNRVLDPADEKYVVGINQAGSLARSEQKRLQEELDTRLRAEYQARIDAQGTCISLIAQDNPFIDNFEEMSGIEIDRRFTGNAAYSRACDWGEMGTHPVVKVMFAQKRKIQCEKVPTLSQLSIRIIENAIELLDDNPSGSDIELAIDVAESL